MVTCQYMSMCTLQHKVWQTTDRGLGLGVEAIEYSTYSTWILLVYVADFSRLISFRLGSSNRILQILWNRATKMYTKHYCYTVQAMCRRLLLPPACHICKCQTWKKNFDVFIPRTRCPRKHCQPFVRWLFFLKHIFNHWTTFRLADKYFQLAASVMLIYDHSKVISSIKAKHSNLNLYKC